MKYDNASDPSLPTSVQKPTNSALEKQIDQLIWTADAPLVLVSESRRTAQDVFPYFDNDPQLKKCAVITIEKDSDLIGDLQQSILSLYPHITKDQLPDCDVDEWSLAVRNAGKAKSGHRLLIVENFDEVLNASACQQGQFSTMVCHLGCESGLTVFLTTTKQDVVKLGALPGFSYLGELHPAGLLEVPGDWAPPSPYVEVAELEKVSTHCFKSNLLLTSAILSAAAMVMVSIWVTEQLGVNLAMSAPTLKNMRAADVQSISVAASSESLPLPAKLPDLPPLPELEEIMFDPIPVALIGEVESGPHHLPHPNDATMPGIPDEAQHSTEEIYLKRLLTVDDYSFESITMADGNINSAANKAPESIVPELKEIEPLKELELVPEDHGIRLSTGSAKKKTVGKKQGNSKVRRNRNANPANRQPADAPKQQPASSE